MAFLGCSGGSVMRFFLRLRAWQLFVLLMFPLLFSGPAWVHLDSEWVSDLLALSVFFIFFAWIYSVGAEFNGLLPEQLGKSLGRFRLAILVALVSMVLLYVLDPVKTPSFEATDPVIPPEIELGSFLVWGGALNLIVFVSFIYSIWFAARQLETYRRKEPLGFIDYSGAFFLFWFFPLGLWFLQPRINRLCEENRPDQDWTNAADE